MFDLIIKNGMVFDGGTAPAYKADLAIKDGVIKEIASCITAPAEKILDVDGLAVAPGFIDIHSHGDCTFLENDQCESKILQGVTAELAGQCGATIYPCKQELMENLYAYVGKNTAYDTRYYASTSLDSFIDKVHNTNKQMSTNLIPLIGHGALRAGLVGFEGRVLTNAELDTLCALMKQEMDSGAWGLSLGLGYTPGVFADQRELNALGKVIAKYDGIITSHMRNQGNKIFEALEEMYEINRVSNARVHIAHLKMSGKEQFGTADKLVENLLAARAKGIAVTADMYPYNASSTGITNILPKWTLEGGIAKAAQRLAGEHRAEIMADLEMSFQEPADGQALYIVSTDGRYPIADDKNIFELSQLLNVSMAQAVAEVIVQTQGATRCIFFAMSEQDVDLLLRQTWVSIGSDGSGIPIDATKNNGKPHPRNFGTFPKVLRLAREEKICTMEQAVNRMTKLCADTIGIADRGQLKVGLEADITIFDANTVSDRATFTDPFQKPIGIPYVLIHGKFAVYEGKQTEERLGRFLLKK